MNKSFGLCPTYGRYLVVPTALDEEGIRKVRIAARIKTKDKRQKFRRNVNVNLVRGVRVGPKETVVMDGFAGPCLNGSSVSVLPPTLVVLSCCSPRRCVCASLLQPASFVPAFATSRLILPHPPPLYSLRLSVCVRSAGGNPLFYHGFNVRGGSKNNKTRNGNGKKCGRPQSGGAVAASRRSPGFTR